MPGWWRSAPMVSSDGADFPGDSGGFVGSLGVLLGVVLAVSALWASGDDRIRMVSGGIFLAIGCYAFLLRPRVTLRNGVLRLVDPLIETEIPVGLIKAAWVGAMVRVQTKAPDDERYSCVAMRRKRSSAFRRRDQLAAPRPIFSFMPNLDAVWNSTDPGVPVATVADTFEQIVAAEIADVRRRHPDRAVGTVRRRITWPLVVPMVLCFVVFAATYFR